MQIAPLEKRSEARSGSYTPVTDFVLVGTDRHLEPATLHGEPRAWIPAVVPGGVHESLLRAGVIEHPYVGRNEESMRWIEERDWWYRTSVEIPADLGPDERLRLVFHGLDTVVRLWMGGVELGSHENMFRPAEFDVTSLAPGRHELLLRFSPPLAGLEKSPAAVEQLRRIGALLGAGDGAEDANDSDGAPSPEMTIAARRRKAMFSWGWDFGPRVPSIGIWQSVDLVRDTRARISGHQVRTESIDIESTTADLTVVVEVDTIVGGLVLSAEVELTSPSGRVHRATLPVVGGFARGRLTVDEVQPWWTHDLGDPSLYDVRLTLRENADVRDRVDDRIGIRTITLDRSADPEGGRLFRFVLNGVPVFARGANWLPASMFVGSVTAKRHRELVELARDGGMTMLRVWGGGIYELDSFYAATDECGVLVWQDFMFACADYESDDRSLQTEVALEAEYQVRRLRNRASLALWCGNNEVHVLHGMAYQQYEPGNWGWDFFHRILPEAVREHDGATPYWPGSPWGEDTPEGFMAVNGVLDGDRHAWEVWHGYDVGAGGGDFETPAHARHFRRFAQDRGRFISEFGIHAAPVLDTLERWIPADELTLHSRTLDAHNKDHPKDKGEALMEIITGLPENLVEYLDFSMVSQAEGLKFGIEHYRRRQPVCNGTLVWQFNDVWPGFSWSVVDHDTVPKAGYYACKRAFSPVVASFVHEHGVLSLWVSNAGSHGISTTVAISVARFDGSSVHEEQVAVAVGPGRSEQVWSLPLVASTDTYAWVAGVDGHIPPNRLFLAEIKDLPLPVSTPTWTVARTGPTSAEVTVKADVFTYLARVTVRHPGARFSDNFLDLRAGDVRTIEITHLPEGFDLADLRVGTYVGVRQS